jgi:hypothetical protein
MKDKSRQQRANVKARKTKARGVAAAAQTLAKVNRRTSSGMSSARHSMDILDRLTRLSSNHVQEKEAAERFLCSVFGEAYRP